MCSSCEADGTSQILRYGKRSSSSSSSFCCCWGALLHLYPRPVHAQSRRQFNAVAIVERKVLLPGWLLERNVRHPSAIRPRPRLRGLLLQHGYNA